MPRLLALCSLVPLLVLLVGTGPADDGEFAGSYGRYAVAADHAAASAAGAEVLAAGGNAADAAAATLLALGVASPASSGLGGGAFILYYRQSDGSLTFIDARERAPAASTPDMFDDAEARTGEGPLAQPSQLGGLASGVPGEMAGIDELLRRFGRAPRQTVFDPAIRLAEQGVEVSGAIAEMSRHFGAQMRADREMRRWMGSAEALTEGETFRQPTLGRTLRTLARDGGAFYRGSVARAIVAANRRAGGIMTAADLADYRVVEREPLTATRFGFRWVTAPPPSAGGYTLLSSLGVLERIGAARRARGAALMHALAESWKGPYMDRQRYFGDPDHVSLPLAALRAEERSATRAARFHPTLAMPPADFALPLPDTATNAVSTGGGGTSHLCVVDEEGNVAAVTSTVNLPFGARYTAAGIVMNDEMDDFAREVGEENAFGLVGGAPNLPGPGKRPVSTMSPTIVFDEQGPVLCVGAAGGSRIVTATQQVAYNILVLGMEPADAMAAPRVHHQAVPDTLYTEEFAPLPEAVAAALTARGHHLEATYHIATVQAIRIGREGPRLAAVSDPRKGGRPAGE